MKACVSRKIHLIGSMKSDIASNTLLICADSSKSYVNGDAGLDNLQKTYLDIVFLRNLFCCGMVSLPRKKWTHSVFRPTSGVSSHIQASLINKGVSTMRY